MKDLWLRSAYTKEHRNDKNREAENLFYSPKETQTYKKTKL